MKFVENVSLGFVILRNIMRPQYYGFISDHTYLNNEQIKLIKSMYLSPDNDIVPLYERSFSTLVGNGFSVSYASSRMGFYDLMKIEGIGSGDEVILNGATCSVMVNAVLRTGAKPIYADIDPNTFGSDVTEIRNVLNHKTKMIVAQHSFGIPCDIKPIVDLAKKNSIFLLEDCALTLGSTVDGIVCGNFGDAALFSTDHTKPLNTLTGGFIYTQNINLFKDLKITQNKSAPLPKKKQKRLWKQLLFERKYSRPDRYARMQLIMMFRSKLKINNRPFLDEDFETNILPNTSYPYPAKLPVFLAVLGLYEVERWQETAKSRKELLKKLLNIIGSNSNNQIPSAYFDSSNSIVPLRLAWAPQNGKNIRNQLSKFIHTSWTWFMQPIVATTVSLDQFEYKSGDCPISENLGPRMVNLPCNLNNKWSNILLKKLKNSGIPWS